MTNNIITTRPVTPLREMEDFRSQRLETIASDPNLLAAKDGSKVILQLVPMAAFDEGNSIDVSLLEHSLWALYGGGGAWRFNFDGRINSSSITDGVDSYVQIFHSGVIESVKIFQERQSIATVALERTVIESTTSYLGAQQTVGVPTPIAILLTLAGVRGCELTVSRNITSLRKFPIDRDQLELPALILNSYPTEVGRELRPLFDRLWQAAGVPLCLHYAADGSWSVTD